MEPQNCFYGLLIYLSWEIIGAKTIEEKNLSRFQKAQRSLKTNSGSVDFLLIASRFRKNITSHSGCDACFDQVVYMNHRNGVVFFVHNGQNCDIKLFHYINSFYRRGIS